MTREEAIKEIEKLDDWISTHPSLLNDWCKTSDALDIAIKALEQKSYKSEARRWKRRYLDLKQRIFKLEEQQPCEDCISREELEGENEE